jgi:hypothetical protein
MAFSRFILHASNLEQILKVHKEMLHIFYLNLEQTLEHQLGARFKKAATPTSAIGATP